jgi:cytochrome c oxidase subunit IV
MISAEYFDILGILAFLFLFIFSVYIYIKFKKVPRWFTILAILVSLAGLIVDLYIVIGNFLVG